MLSNFVGCAENILIIMLFTFVILFEITNIDLY